MSRGEHTEAEHHEAVELPAPTGSPFVMAVGITLVALGLATTPVFCVAGLLLLVAGQTGWVRHMLPGGGGHIHQALAPPEERPAPVQGVRGRVEHMGRGSPGYRLRLPTEVHPITAGIKGGIAGGIAMTVPALAYGLFSGKGIWYPVNLLAGMVVPGLTADEAAQFHAGLLILGVVIHVMMSLIMGLVYGVLLPTLPEIPREISWGGLLAPLLWTAVSFVLMGVVNPKLQEGVNWFWFVVSQFVYGIAMAAALMTARKKMRPIPAAVVGGLVGAVAMPIPAVLWSLVSGRGPWYPANLLAGMVMPDMRALPLEQLQAFRADWLVAALAIHLVMSIAFAVALTVLLPRLPPIPGPMAWGALLMPLLWTGVAYGLMGVINPLLQEKVSWPWFVVSQFVFGVAASIIVVRSEKVYIPPAGTGPEDTQMERWGTGEPTKSEEGTPPGQGEGPR